MSEGYRKLSDLSAEDKKKKKIILPWQEVTEEQKIEEGKIEEGKIEEGKIEKEAPGKIEAPEETEEQKIDRILSGSGQQFQALNFSHPLELIAYLDDSIQTGLITLYSWQVETSQLFSLRCFSKAQPLELYVVAANGSGKDAYINSAVALWGLLCNIRARVVITSSSYTQLKNQTESYISFGANQANKKLKEDGTCQQACIVKKDHIISALTGSEIQMFVTDDPGKAEGYHPFPDNPNGLVIIITNEAKSIPDEIFQSLSRCTYTHWLSVSSPGQPSGYFYDRSSSAVQYPEPFNPKKKYARRVTSYDCKHIARSKIEDDKVEWGENSPLFRSKHLALFTSLDEAVVIIPEQLERCLKLASEKYDLKLPRRAGLDLAAGGDENALYIFDQNICIGYEIFRASDTSGVTAKHLARLFKKYELDEENIYGDDGGVGRSIIDDIKEHHGYSINRVLNQSPALYKREYGNRGAELWFKFARLVQENIVVLPKEDIKLHKQLKSRHYVYSDSGKIILESKQKARSNGHGSPDRADAVVLAFTGYGIQDFRKATKKVITPRMTHQEVEESYEDIEEEFNKVKQLLKRSPNPARLHRMLCHTTKKQLPWN